MYPANAPVYPLIPEDVNGGIRPRSCWNIRVMKPADFALAAPLLTGLTALAFAAPILPWDSADPIAALRCEMAAPFPAPAFIAAPVAASRAKVTRFAAGAEGGYGACVAAGRSHASCKDARTGYGACVADGYSHSSCVGAKGGYAACIADGYSHHSCLTAPEGYKDCVANGYSHSSCK